MNSLTLKSEYSEEFSELLKDSNLDDQVTPRKEKRNLCENREDKNKIEEEISEGTRNEEKRREQVIITIVRNKKRKGKSQNENRKSFVSRNS